MATDAKGFGIRVIMECYNPEDERWSVTSNRWMGLQDEHTMNMMANGCMEALVNFSKAMNEQKYGPKKAGGPA